MGPLWMRGALWRCEAFGARWMRWRLWSVRTL